MVEIVVVVEGCRRISRPGGKDNWRGRGIEICTIVHIKVHTASFSRILTSSFGSDKLWNIFLNRSCTDKPLRRNI